MSMLVNGRNRTGWGLVFNGCSCHNNSNSRRRAKKAAKNREKRALCRDLLSDRQG